MSYRASTRADCQSRPRGQEVSGAEQTGVVGIIPDHLQDDIRSLRVEQQRRARYSEFANPARPEAAADDNTFGAAPVFEAQISANDLC
jgi:hypothetical protein